LTSNELVLTFGNLHICVQFGENRQRNATVRVSTHGQTDIHRQRDRQTDANLFYYLSHALCYSYGADNNNKKYVLWNMVAEFIGDSATSTGQIVYFSLRMRETAIFLLPVTNPTLP